MLSHRFDFHGVAGSRLPTAPLSSESRADIEALPTLFPNFLALPYPNVSERGKGAMSRSLYLERELSDPTVLQIKQRERSCYFRQL